MNKTTVEQINDQLRRFFQDCLNRNAEIAAFYPDDPEFDVYGEADDSDPRRVTKTGSAQSSDPANDDPAANADNDPAQADQQD